MNDYVKTVRILVRGKVQGVFFRQATREKALDLGLNGSVQNLANGNVLIYASAPPAVLSQFIAWCRLGPSRAEVTDLEISDEPIQLFEGFRILH